MKLLSLANAKTPKGEKLGVLTGVMYLAPARLSGREVCAKATDGCRKACLFTAGRGAYSKIQTARIAKTQAFFADREKFMRDLEKDIEALIRKADRENFVPAVRLNGTSDLPWERIRYGEDRLTIFERFPDVQFYDYTKHGKRNPPPNYNLTFSLAESNEAEALLAILNGMNVAVVFRNELPETYLGLPVINGDETDVRFYDPKGVVVGLKAKGKARRDTSGFVKDVN